MTSGCFIQTLVILYKNVGIAMVSTLVATVLSIAASVPVAKLQEHYQDKLMATKDERMRKTSECVTPRIHNHHGKLLNMTYNHRTKNIRKIQQYFLYTFKHRGSIDI
jgi:hypothetical protein